MSVTHSLQRAHLNVISPILEPNSCIFADLNTLEVCKDEFTVEDVLTCIGPVAPSISLQYASIVQCCFHSPSLSPLLFPRAAVKAKLFRRRVPSADPELEVEGKVEFIERGPLLPYSAAQLLQQWLLLNLRCAHAMVRPGLKKDVHIATAARKWKQHKC